MSFYVGDNELIFTYDLFTKQYNNNSNPIIIKNSGIEISQDDYDILKFSNELVVSKVLDLYLDLHYLRDLVYENQANLVKVITNIKGIGKVWNNITGSYEDFNILNMNNYLDENCILRAEYANPNYIQIKIYTSRIRDIISPIPIVLQ